MLCFKDTLCIRASFILLTEKLIFNSECLFPQVNNVLPVPSPLPTTLSPQLTDLLQGTQHIINNCVIEMSVKATRIIRIFYSGSQSPWILSSLLAYSFAGTVHVM